MELTPWYSCGKDVWLSNPQAEAIIAETLQELYDEYRGTAISRLASGFQSQVYRMLTEDDEYAIKIVRVGISPDDEEDDGDLEHFARWEDAFGARNVDVPIYQKLELGRIDNHEWLLLVCPLGKNPTYGQYNAAHKYWSSRGWQFNHDEAIYQWVMLPGKKYARLTDYTCCDGRSLSPALL